MAGVVAETLSDSNTQRQKGTVSSRASFCAVNKDFSRPPPPVKSPWLGTATRTSYQLQFTFGVGDEEKGWTPKQLQGQILTDSMSFAHRSHDALLLVPVSESPSSGGFSCYFCTLPWYTEINFAAIRAMSPENPLCGGDPIYVYLSGPWCHHRISVPSWATLSAEIRDVAIFLLLFHPSLRVCSGREALVSTLRFYNLSGHVLSLTVPYLFLSPRAQSKYHRVQPVSKPPLLWNFLPTPTFLLWASLYNLIGVKACSDLSWFYLYQIFSAPNLMKLKVHIGI